MQKDRKKHNLRRLVPYFSSEKKRLGIGVIAALAITVAHLVRPLILRRIIDGAIPSGDIGMAVVLALVFVFALVLGALIQYFQVINLAKIALNIVTFIKKKVFGHILSLDMGFFDKNPPGRLMARTESDIESLKNIFSHSAMVLLQSFLLLIGITAIILYEEPAYGLILLVLFPVMAVAVRFYLSYIMRIWTIVRRKNSFLSGYITEYIQAVPIIQLFVKKKEAVDMIVRHSVDKMKYERKANFTDYVIFWTFFQFITETVALAVIFYIGISKILKGDMSIGSLIMYTEFMRQLAMPLRNLMQVLSQIQASLAASSRVFDILDTPAKVREHAENDIIPSLRDSIEFEKIAFAYDKEDVIRNISMSIRAGEHVAIIGPSGSGKTTIINLLLRFYELEKGRILIDNTDIKGYRIENLRKRIGLVLQDVYLFPGTILDNLKAFNPDVCDESVFEASRKLGAHELIMKKSDGYATELSEGGSNLSMGERQLISFIRAMVKDPDLLILDEATSSVDVITENMLQRALSRLMEGRTAIIIAHRLSTIQNADKIIVFNNGRIEEEGSHGELMAKGGLYSRLYKIQEVKA